MMPCRLVLRHDSRLWPCSRLWHRPSLWHRRPGGEHGGTTGETPVPHAQASGARVPQVKVIRRGATIIEVVAAIVILSIALPPLVSAFADASMQSIHPSLATVGAFLAIERMEEVVAWRYRTSDGYDDVSDPAVLSAEFPNESPVSDFASFDRSVTSVYVDYDENGVLQEVETDQGYTKVLVTVTWSSGSDSIAVERLFADY